MLLKQEEAYYADSITTRISDDKKTSPKVLVLLTKMDRKGQFLISLTTTPNNSLGAIYSRNNNFYNIESGEL
jgi:hypothetical protein